MSDANLSAECPPEVLTSLLESMRDNSDLSLPAFAAAVRDYPRDGRLPFLQGSLLASLRRYDEARAAMHQAIAVAPDFAVARFQTGFLELTSGNAALAMQVWLPLDQLSPEDPLRLFAVGLSQMARDDFPSAIATLREGIARNTTIPPLNADMQLIIDELQKPKSEGGARDGAPAEEPMSASHLLLQQYLNKTKH